MSYLEQRHNETEKALKGIVLEGVGIISLIVWPFLGPVGFAFVAVGLVSLLASLALTLEGNK
jgi:hypothetical protein